MRCMDYTATEPVHAKGYIMVLAHCDCTVCGQLLWLIAADSVQLNLQLHAMIVGTVGAGHVTCICVSFLLLS
jgi:hypothetical protein